MPKFCFQINSPDGHSPDESDQSKWPLQPGVLIHINKMNNVSISQITPRINPYKTTSVATLRKFSKYSKYKRNRSKIYDRLERIANILGMSRRRERIPSGIKESAGGVVTFRKVHPNSPIRNPPIRSRKRKKPGYAPNMSSTEDKPRLGAGLPLGGTADPLSDPDGGFYENLPFHGMQNPPNKPISIIAPFHQRNPAQRFIPPSMSTKSLLSSTQTLALQSQTQSSQNLFNAVKRHQSFNGFQNTLYRSPFASSQQIFNLSGNFNGSYLNSASSQQHILNTSHPRLPSIFSHLPPSFAQPTGSYTISGIPSNIHNNLSTSNLRKTNTASTETLNRRISGRNEEKYDIRRSASGINKSTNDPERSSDKGEIKRRGSTISNRKLTTIVEKRFGSLDIRNHKCYSPTFYSMRCKKHAKKRPIIVTLPKKCFSDLALSSRTENIESKTENLTDSIQITEESPDNEKLSKSLPTPAPRNRKQHEIIYANIFKSLNTSITSDKNTSNSSNEVEENEPSVTEVEVHAETIKTPTEQNSSCPLVSSSPLTSLTSSTTSTKPKLVALSPKTSNSIILLSPQALKNSPVLKVSPNFIKPKTESPKGALSRQIQAKIKPSPENLIEYIDNKEFKVETEDKVGGKTSEQISKVPKMPILNSVNNWSTNVTNNNQNAFYTLSTPNFKQLNSVVPPQYSATIPHQKHTKLIPKALFQEQMQKSKSFSSKSKHKKNHFQIPLQKCHSFKFQTAESYFQPIKNIHEENLMRNGYVSDYPESSLHRGRHHKRDKQKQKTKGPLVLRRPSDYQGNMQFQENIQNSVQLQYPQPLLAGRNLHGVTNKPNGVVYADLDMPSNKRSSHDSSSKSKSQKPKQKTEYATLKFNDIGQEIDV